MSNATRGTISINGRPVHNISNFSANPSGGSVGSVRGHTPTRRPLGFRKGQKPEWSLSWEYTVLDGEPEIDFQAMWENETEFDLANDLDTSTMLYSPVMITEISDSLDDDDTMKRSVSALALNRKRI